MEYYIVTDEDTPHAALTAEAKYTGTNRGLAEWSAEEDDFIFTVKVIRRESAEIVRNFHSVQEF